jgi:hypothetical protein
METLRASYEVVVKALINNIVRRRPEVKSLLRQAVKRAAQCSIEKEASDDDDDGSCCWRGRVPAEVEALIEDKKARLSSAGGGIYDRTLAHGGVIAQMLADCVVVVVVVRTCSHRLSGRRATRAGCTYPEDSPQPV